MIFDTLQKSITDPDKFAYGDAWENTHVYNSIGEFVNFWGGDYLDWMNPRTQEAVRRHEENAGRWNYFSGSAGRSV